MEPILVLLVEDNPADADLAIETLATSRVALKIEVVTDGVQALEYLRKQGEYFAVPRPDLVLLDLNLPKLSGRQVLHTMKTDDSLKAIPVVILTSSAAETDVLETYGLGANCFVTKPVDLQAFQTIVQAVENFWFTVVKLPPKD